MMTEDPFRLHAHAPRALGFQVDDSADGDSARGDFHGRWPGVIRPLLEWRTRFEPVRWAVRLMVVLKRHVGV